MGEPYIILPREQLGTTGGHGGGRLVLRVVATETRVAARVGGSRSANRPVPSATASCGHPQRSLVFDESVVGHFRPKRVDRRR